MDQVCLIARLFSRRRSERGFLRVRPGLASCRTWLLEAGSVGADVGTTCSVLRRRVGTPLMEDRWAAGSETAGAAIWMRDGGTGR